jgi:hypothetical protein
MPVCLYAIWLPRDDAKRKQLLTKILFNTPTTMIGFFHLLAMTASLFSLVSALATTKPNVLQKALLRVGGGKQWREQVVARYFDGVEKQDREQIVSCFDPSGTKIRDVCGVSNSARTATPDELGERCMEFLAAHPDTQVLFHYPYVGLHYWFASKNTVLVFRYNSHFIFFDYCCIYYQKY